MFKITKYKGYSVSDSGEVRRDSTRRILKQQSSRGYKTVALSVRGKVTRVYVHILVASCFLSNEDNLPEVNHKDFDKSNNSVDNLEWCDRFGNMQHAKGISLVVDGITYPSIGECHRATGLAVSTIRRRLAQGRYKS